MLERLDQQFRSAFSAWFGSGAFWKTFFGALTLTLFAKVLVNQFIEPIPFYSPLSSLRGQIFPFPPGLVAITHSQHWSDDGAKGILFILLGAISVLLFLAFAHRVIDAKLAHIGTALFLAGVISNRGEVWLFGHATDFVFIRLKPEEDLAAIVNFADVMILSGLVLMLLAAPAMRLISAKRRSGVPNPAGSDPAS